ncbi:MAG TPA: FtsX-like permease family protein, partial [Acidimicrobiales bacterium]
ARYRTTITLRRRLGGLAAVAVLTGGLGGIALAATAGARRTQSSFATFEKSTNPSDLNVSVGPPGGGSLTPTDEATFDHEVASLPGVRRVASFMVLDAVPETPSGGLRLDTVSSLEIGGSLDGLYTAVDRVSVVQGRLFDPARDDEMVMSADLAALLGVRVGGIVPMSFFSDEQTSEPGFGTPAVAPTLRRQMRVVGIVVFNDQVVQDDVDRSTSRGLVSPALTRLLLPGTSVAYHSFQLEGGASSVPTFERAVIGLLPANSTYTLHVAATTAQKANRSARPAAIALGAFGLIAAIVALLVAGQAVARQVRADAETAAALRAFGASTRTVVLAGTLDLLGAVGVGALLAVGVAVGLSSLSPVGPVRPVYPDRGVSIDGLVLVLGALVLVAVLAATAVVLTARGAAHRAAGGDREATLRRSVLAGFAARAGLSPSGVVGVGFAFESGRGRNAVSVRAALVSTAVAVGLVAATATFASSLQTLVSHPSLYGWSWDSTLIASYKVPPATATALDHDPDVAAWAGYDLATASIDGQTVPVLLGGTKSELGPPLISGHDVDHDDEIVLGESTLAQLHRHIGDTVTVQYGNPDDAPIYVPPTRLTIVGAATLPAVGFPSAFADHISMGTGAVLSRGVEPPAFQQALVNPDDNFNGSDVVFVRQRSDLSAAAKAADLRHILGAGNNALQADPSAGGDTLTALPVERPAEIVNYRSIGATPTLLAAGLAVGAFVALVLTLVASVRRRRQVLAWLKALGFTPRQLQATVAWQASVDAVVGIVVGGTLGIALGRWLWTLFARSIAAVPEPTIPVPVVIALAAGTLVLANIAAAIPGRLAARTPTANLLRNE